MQQQYLTLGHAQKHAHRVAALVRVCGAVAHAFIENLLHAAVVLAAQHFAAYEAYDCGRLGRLHQARGHRSRRTTFILIKH